MASAGGTTRIDFTDGVIRETARKAMYVCSNPGCLRVTGYQTTTGRARAVAQAAHILPAAAKGPRKDVVVTMPDGSTLKPGDEGNAIWLCLACHSRIDADPEGFPAELLLAWKREHEVLISSLVDLDLEQSLLRLGGARRSHDIALDLLLWLDGHRFMYFDDAREMPDYVWRAVEALRAKLFDLRARVADSESRVGKVLDGVDSAVHQFVDSLNDVRIDEIVVTSGESDFEHFSRALGDLRRDILRLISPLAQDESYTFKRIRLS